MGSCTAGGAYIPAMCDETITAFIFETKTPGFHVARKLSKVGLHGSPTAELVFEDAFVPETNVLGKVNEGYKIVMSGLDIERAFDAVIGVGTIAEALHLALKYAQEREQFGQPIASFQLLQAKIAQMYTDLEAARQVAHRAIWLAQQELRVRKETAAARAANEALQMHGSWGYLTDFDVERLWRDARLGEITKASLPLSSHTTSEKACAAQRTLHQQALQHGLSH